MDWSSSSKISECEKKTLPGEVILSKENLTANFEGLLLKERLCSLREQILPFQICHHFGNALFSKKANKVTKVVSPCENDEKY